MPFLRNAPGLEAVYRDYAPKGVQFFVVYKSIVHPGTNGFVDAVTKRERLQQLAIAKRRLKTTVPMVSDSLDGAIVRALDAAPNCEFVVDADGTVLSRKFWHDPKALRAMLAERVGPVDEPTRVADLDMDLVFPERHAQRGVVPPQPMPGGMKILQTSAVLPAAAAARDDAAPFFAKLIAEGDEALLERGRGKLYVGFHLDPLYEVHWNNPAGGLSWRIEATDGAPFEPVTGRTPEYEHDADVDPREFLVDAALPKDRPLQLTVRYTICADDDSVCKPVEQRYALELAPAPGRPSRAGDWMTRIVGDPMQWDADGDRRVTRAELPDDRAQIILLHCDRDHDEVITPAEAAQLHEMIRIAPGETGR